MRGGQETVGRERMWQEGHWSFGERLHQAEGSALDHWGEHSCGAEDWWTLRVDLCLVVMYDNQTLARGGAPEKANR